MGTIAIPILVQKMKTKTVAKLKKEADKWFSLYIRTRDSQDGLAECITCGVSKPIKEMQNGHFVRRSVNLLRYDELNCNDQCVGCNMFKAGDLYLYGKALDTKYGDGTADELQGKRFLTHKLTIQELEEIIKNAKEYLKEMG